MSSTCFEPEGSSSGRLLYIQLWYGTVLYCTVRYGTVCTVRYGTVRYCTVRYCMYGTVRYCTVRYGTVCTVRYCTVLYVRYGTVLYGTVRYCTVRYCMYGTVRYGTNFLHRIIELTLLLIRLLILNPSSGLIKLQNSCCLILKQQRNFKGAFFETVQCRRTGKSTECNCNMGHYVPRNF